MAKMIPRKISKSSFAENEVFEKLKKLSDDYVVMYSLGLSEHINKIKGEIDFVIICKKGILCIEVKGGKVSRKDGIWEVEDGNGNKNELKEDPFKQASGNMYSLRNYLLNLEKDKSLDINMSNILFAYTLIIPDVNFKVEGPDINENELITKKEFINSEIEDLINKKIDYHSDKYVQKYNRKKVELTDLDIEKLTTILRRDLGYVQSLSNDLEEIKEELIYLTNEQKKVLDTMAGNDRVIIKGTGGTGKTVLMYEEMLRSVISGKKVIFLCYNKPLSQHLNNILEKENKEIRSNIKISTLHAYMFEQLKILNNKYHITGDQDDFFKKVLPQDFVNIDNEKYDIMIIDEAQDILNDMYIKCIEKIVEGGLKNGKWYISIDENQNLYDNIELDSLFEKIKNDIRPAIAILTKNCRNTKQISSFNAKVTTIEQSINDNVSGNDVVKIPYRNNTKQQEEVIKIVEYLKSNGIRNDEIVILSKKSYKSSVFNGNNFLNKLSEKIEIVGEYNKEYRDRYIKFSTIKGFKGLESKVVILCDVDSVDDEKSRRLNYVAISRAKTLLYVLYNYKLNLTNINNNIDELVDQILGKE